MVSFYESAKDFIQYLPTLILKLSLKEYKNTVMTPQPMREKSITKIKHQTFFNCTFLKEISRFEHIQTI